MCTFYLVRHAHATWNTDEQRPLSAQGCQAAQQLVSVLGQLPISAIYASSARRAYQTVEPLANHFRLSVQQCDDFMERRLSAEPVSNFLAAVAQSWHAPAESLRGGESNQAAQARSIKALHHVAQHHPGEHIMIGTHGNLLALMLQWYDPTIDFAFWQQLSMPDVYRLDLQIDPPAAAERLYNTMYSSIAS